MTSVRAVDHAVMVHAQTQHRLVGAHAARPESPSTSGKPTSFIVSYLALPTPGAAPPRRPGRRAAGRPPDENWPTQVCAREQPKGHRVAAYELIRLLYTMLIKGEQYTDRHQQNGHKTGRRRTTCLKTPLQIHHLPGAY